jgi:hypothetical protein
MLRKDLAEVYSKYKELMKMELSPELLNLRTKSTK